MYKDVSKTKSTSEPKSIEEIPSYNTPKPIEEIPSYNTSDAQKILNILERDRKLARFCDNDAVRNCYNRKRKWYDLFSSRWANEETKHQFRRAYESGQRYCPFLHLSMRQNTNESKGDSDL